MNKRIVKLTDEHIEASLAKPDDGSPILRALREAGFPDATIGFDKGAFNAWIHTKEKHPKPNDAPDYGGYVVKHQLHRYMNNYYRYFKHKKRESLYPIDIVLYQNGDKWWADVG